MDADTAALLEWGLKGFEGWTNHLERLAQKETIDPAIVRRLAAVNTRLKLLIEDQDARPERTEGAAVADGQSAV